MLPGDSVDTPDELLTDDTPDEPQIDASGPETGYDSDPDQVVEPDAVAADPDQVDEPTELPLAGGGLGRPQHGPTPFASVTMTGVTPGTPPSAQVVASPQT